MGVCNFVTICVLPLLFVIGTRAEDHSNYTVYDTKRDCEAACIGDHDVDCALSPKGDGQQHVCRCVSGYYSRLDYCQIECEENQFWSLFTYGLCSEYQSKVLPGSCNKQCVFRVRVWATVFVIIVFVAAVIVILFLLPNLIATCVTCCQLRRQQRHIDDLQIVQSELGSGAGTLGKSNPVLTSWNHTYHPAYYGRAY